MQHLIICAGLPGTGKTTIATLVQQEIAGILLRSDVLRKEFESNPIYTPDARQTYYTLMFERARAALSQSINVVLDATFNKAANRATAKALAEELGAQFTILEVVSNEDIVKARIEKRQAEGKDPSDADFAVYLKFKEQLWEHIEDDEGRHIIINNSGDKEDLSSIIKDIFVQ